MDATKKICWIVLLRAFKQHILYCFKLLFDVRSCDFSSQSHIFRFFKQPRNWVQIRFLSIFDKRLFYDIWFGFTPLPQVKCILPQPMVHPSTDVMKLRASSFVFCKLANRHRNLLIFRNSTSFANINNTFK